MVFARTKKCPGPGGGLAGSTTEGVGGGASPGLSKLLSKFYGKSLVSIEFSKI